MPTESMGTSVACHLDGFQNCWYICWFKSSPSRSVISAKINLPITCGLLRFGRHEKRRILSNALTKPPIISSIVLAYPFQLTTLGGGILCRRFLLPFTPVAPPPESFLPQLVNWLPVILCFENVSCLVIAKGQNLDRSTSMCTRLSKKRRCIRYVDPEVGYYIYIVSQLRS